MNHPCFWIIIQETKQWSGGDTDLQVLLLEERLKDFPIEDILAFQDIFDPLFNESYQPALRQALLRRFPFLSE